MTKQTPMDTSCEAEYQDGYIHNETDLKDQSTYLPLEMVDGVPTGANTFNDIYHGRPVADHGPMVRFSVFFKNERHDIDWLTVPDGARPIRLRDGQHTWYPDGSEAYGFISMRFGYQYTDQDGKNQKIIRELK